MSFIFVLFMLHLLTVCALYVCLCDYVNMCMYLVLLCIFGKKLLRACVYCLQKPNSNKVFLSYYLPITTSYTMISTDVSIVVLYVLELSCDYRENTVDKECFWKEHFSELFLEENRY